MPPLAVASSTGPTGTLTAYTGPATIETYTVHYNRDGSPRMGTASAVARLGGILAPSLLAVVFARGFGLAIGSFAVLLLLAAAALLLIRIETRDRAIG